MSVLGGFRSGRLVSQLQTLDELESPQAQNVIDRLRKLSLKQRREIPGLNPDRADIIVPGLTTIDRIMRRFKVNLLQVHSYGVRDGLLLSMIQQLQGDPDAGSIDQVDQID